MALRISDTFRIGKRLKVGASIGTNGRPRFWATERVTKHIKITESTGGRGKRRRKR